MYGYQAVKIKWSRYCTAATSLQDRGARAALGLVMYFSYSPMARFKQVYKSTSQQVNKSTSLQRPTTIKNGMINRNGDSDTSLEPFDP